MIYLLIFLPVVILILVLFVIFGLNITLKKYKQLNIENSKEIKEEVLEEDETKSEILETFPVKINDKTIFVKMEKIIAFCAEDNYLTLKDMDGNSYLFDYTLKSLSEKLPKNFIRIHRSVIINKTHIKEIHKYFNGRYAVIMNDKLNSKIISSQSYSTVIKELTRIWRSKFYEF